MSVAEHKSHAPASVRCFVLTVSDSRTLETETSGRAIADLLTEAGHVVTARDLVRDEPADVARLVREQARQAATDAILITGGTGLSRRDSTYEALTALFEKRLDGFGELFRILSFQDIGPSAMLSRACAGTLNGRAIFSMPGSESAVRLAMTRLVLPELSHVVQQLRKVEHTT